MYTGTVGSCDTETLLMSWKASMRLWAARFIWIDGLLDDRHLETCETLKEVQVPFKWHELVNSTGYNSFLLVPGCWNSSPLVESKGCRKYTCAGARRAWRVWSTGNRKSWGKLLRIGILNSDDVDTSQEKI